MLDAAAMSPDHEPYVHFRDIVIGHVDGLVSSLSQIRKEQPAFVLAVFDLNTGKYRSLLGVRVSIIKFRDEARA